ncbi:hypothetical protein [Opitutus sp. ER46]|uniref:hypothetical protein n=1 Tax=Opitutus sp. ER46 TaxID=2161864 RepID=UPI000D321A6A|nr:hypothetical protein [Opitutus sp. ER46]PTX91499.1 hypothetical protein DB354_16560 [Opitutus sp. ER46]
MNPQDQQKLEQWVNRAVRDLPSRRAPRSLEERVLAELSRRAALPWWRKSFASWPLGAKLVFIAVSAGVAGLWLFATHWATLATTAVQTKAASLPALQAAQTAGRLFSTVGEFGHTVVSSIPPLWLYGGAAVIVGLYLALFGLGAAAYRTLYASS